MKNFKNGGFTLIETLIAITILTLAVAGPLESASRAVIAAETAREQLTASYLAQESIEYVRMMRDDEYLALSSSGSAAVWSDFLTGSRASSITACRASTCTLDPARQMGTGSGLSLTTCSGNTCGPLYLANGIYTQQSGIPGSTVTLYTRTLQAMDVTPNDERIVSTVTWKSHGTTYSVQITDHLTSWE